MTELHPTNEMVLDAEIEQITLRERIACSRFGRAVLGSLTAASMVVGGTVISTESASAESNYTYAVTGTNGEGVWLHADPGIEDEGDHYPEVAEWSIYDGREPTPYVERGWTHSKKSNAWLQEKFPNITAYLLDIDTTQTGEF